MQSDRDRYWWLALIFLLVTVGFIFAGYKSLTAAGLTGYFIGAWRQCPQLGGKGGHG